MLNQPLRDWRSHVADEAGTPRLRSAGVAVADVLRGLLECESVEAFLTRRPGLCTEDVRACLAFAAEAVERASPVPEGESATPTLIPPTIPPAAGELTPSLPTRVPRAGEEVVRVVATAQGGRRVSIPGFEVLGELGRGGMGVVYKARHLALNRVVAVKMIRAGEFADQLLLARFEREAQAVARLHHPNVVQIYEVGEASGHPFLVLEFVTGGSLAGRLDANPWDAAASAALVEKLARAVHHAHEQGITHRDLKPENVLLTEQGEPKVTDFGLAKRVDEKGPTRSGEVMGTPCYMAPEQAKGEKDVGPSADVHALGGVLYRLVTGRPPFDGPTTLDVLASVLRDDPVAAGRLNPDLPGDLETICHKCLRKNPDHRYASAAELADDLARFLAREPIQARPPTPAERAFRWAGRHPVLAGLRVLMGVVVLATFLGAVFGDRPLEALTNLAWSLALFVGLARARPAPVALGFLAIGPLFLLLPLLREGRILSDLLDSGPLIVLYLAMPVAIVLGIALSEKWYVTLTGALALSVLTWFGTADWQEALFAPCAAATFAFVPVVVSRVVRNSVGGQLIDVVLGFMVGSIPGGLFVWVLLPLSVPMGDDTVGPHPITLLSRGCIFVGGLCGSLLAARASRTPDQRLAPPDEAEA